MSHEPLPRNQCPHCGSRDRVDLAPTPPGVLNTNTPPSESEAETIHASRTRAGLRVQELNERITAIKTTLQSYSDEKERVETMIADYNKTLHPLRSAPDDILTRIFLTCLDDTIYVTGRKTSLDPRQMPWTLSHVSRRWRSISLAFPRLWSSIAVRLDPELEDPVACLARQLQRSASHDLLVWICSDIDDNNPLLPLLLSSSTRWKQLSLRISLPNLRSFSSIAGNIQGLQTLYFFLDDHESPPLMTDITSSAHSIQTMFEVAPLLRVVVAYEQRHLKPFESDLPWDHIRDLEAVTAEPGELLNTLRRAPHIESVTCQGLRCQEESLSGIVQCPSIRALVLDFETSQSFQLLWHIRAPLLQTLKLTLQYVVDITAPGRYESIVFAHSLQVLFEQSHPPLATLTLVSTFLTNDDCLRLLEGIPTLRSLTLDPFTCTPKFRVQLANKPSLVPLLAELSIGIDEKPIEASMGETVLEKMRELMTARGDLEVRLWKKDKVQLVSLNQVA